MVEHHASVIVAASAERIFQDFSRYERYPQIITDIREVTLLDNETSRWVVDVMGRHEWVARNENWIENRQIGWMSTSGMQNRGLIRFEPLEPARTRVDVRFWYAPPGGAIGELGEKLGIGHSFEQRLQHDLDRYAASFEAQQPLAADDSFTGSVSSEALEMSGVTGTAGPAEDNTAPAIFEVTRSTVPGTMGPELLEEDPQ